MGATAQHKVVPLSLHGLKETCSKCNLRELCLPLGLNAGEIVQLDKLVANSRILKHGSHLYRTGDHFDAIFVIKTGFFKTYMPGKDGHDMVTGFHMGGEILGMDGISGDVHTCNVVSLEDSHVCPIPFSGLEALSSAVPTLQRHFHRVMSREIIRDHGVMMLLGTMHAEERLAVFLLNLSQRFTARGYSPDDFHLRMSRDEIGSYLGLKLESVSRAFSHLQEQGLIAVHLRHIRILKIAGLKELLAHT